jgi:hypothetical protein
MAKKPTQFKDLSKNELVRSALEDFAVELTDEEKTNKASVLAAFAESNLVWEDYVAQHPEVAPEPAPVAVTSNAPSHGTIGDDTVEGFITPVVEDEVTTEPGEIVVAAPAVAGAPNDQYLLKMTRENPVYQTRGYEFTEDHPYALVNAADAQWILSNEDGFRQAFPAELAEFYG